MDLRIIGDSATLVRADAVITAALGPSIFSSDGTSLEEVVVRLLTERKQTLAIAESCTGGFLAHRITNVPGASAVFLAGFITYSNEAKTGMLEVDPRIIEAAGAVSEDLLRAKA